MKKSELLAIVTTIVTQSFAVGRPVTKEMVDGAINKLTAEIGPKTGGGTKRNVDEIIKVENGKTVAIFDTIAKVWLPATADCFYEEKVEDKKEPKLNGLKNHSKAREKVDKLFVKHSKMAKDAIWAGNVEADILSKEEVKTIMGAVPKKDYSTIVPYGQEGAGTVKPSPDSLKFEEFMAKVNGKITQANKAAASK